MTNAPRTDAATSGTSALQTEETMAGATPIRQGDGRNLRRERNRDAVITALIDLIREGDMEPTVAKIADRAAVSHRSVFRYFDDLNDLARTAIDTEFRRTAPLSVIENLGEGTLDERIREMVAASIRVFERTHLLGLVARARAIDIEEVNRGLTRIYGLRLEQVHRQFAPELSEMSAAKAKAIAAAVLAIMDLESFDAQHRMVGRQIEEIAEMWRTALHALLD